VQAFESAEAFLFSYAEDKDYDILLLDIQMKNMSGIDLAREIRKDNEMLQIIFITGLTDYIAEGYDVSALHYLSAKQAVLFHLPVIILAAITFGVLTVLGFTRAYRTNRFGFWFLLANMTIPLLLAAMASLVPGFSTNPRYLMVSIIPYWIVLALGVQSSVQTRAGYIIPIAAVALTGVSLWNYYFLPVYAKQDMRSAAEVVNHNAAPGDVIIISSVELGGPFIYYFNRHGVPYYGYPPRGGFVDATHLPHDMRKLTSHRKRVWLLLGRTWSSDPRGLILSNLRSRGKVTFSKQFQGVSVSCFQLPSRFSTTQTQR
jgi:hypothetical protein